MHTSIYVGACFKTSELDYYPLIISPGSFAPTFTNASWGPADRDIPITARLKGKNKKGRIKILIIYILRVRFFG